MAPPSWTDQEQATFLWSKHDNYSKAKAGTLSFTELWDDIMAGWIEKWPLINTLFPGLSIAELDASQRVQYHDEYQKLKKKIKTWCSWRFNPRGRSNGGNVPSKEIQAIYSGQARALKDYEVFNKLYPEVVAEYHRQACKQTELKGRDQIAAWQRNCKEAYLHASVEQKDAVEEKMKSEGDRTEDESSPQDYQHFLDLLPRVLTKLVDPAVRKAGVMAVMTIIGPVPKEEGKIASTSLQFGDKDTTPLFSAAWAQHDSIFLEQLGTFARRHEFPLDLCNKRALSAVQEKTESPQEPNPIAIDAPSDCVPPTLVNPAAGHDAPPEDVQPGASSASSGGIDGTPSTLNQLSLPAAFSDPGMQDSIHSSGCEVSDMPEPDPGVLEEWCQAARHLDGQSMDWIDEETLARMATDPVDVLKHKEPVLPHLIDPLFDVPNTPVALNLQPAAPASSVVHSNVQHQTPQASSPTLPALAPKRSVQAVTSFSPETISAAPLGNCPPRNAPSFSPSDTSMTSLAAGAPTNALYGTSTTTNPISSTSDTPSFSPSFTSLLPDAGSIPITPSDALFGISPNATLVSPPSESPPDPQPSSDSNTQPKSSFSLFSTAPTQRVSLSLQRPVKPSARASSFWGFSPPTQPQAPATPLQSIVAPQPVVGPQFPAAAPQQPTVAPPEPIVTLQPVQPAVTTQAVVNSQPVVKPQPVVVPQQPVITPQHPHQRVLTTIPPVQPLQSTQTTNSFHPPDAPSYTPLRSSSHQKENIPPGSASHHQVPPPLPNQQDDRSIANGDAQQPLQPSSAANVPASRRSTRRQIPSTRREQLNMIGTNPPPRAKVDDDDCSQPPNWFIITYGYLQSCDELGEAWRTVVAKWGQLERAYQYGKNSKGLPAKLRPEEWGKYKQKFLNNGFKSVDQPAIADPADLGFAVMKWWKSLQHPARIGLPTDVLPVPVYHEATVSDMWATIRKFGGNGLVSLMALMFWWGRAAANPSGQFQFDSRINWNSMLADIDMSFDALLSTAPSLKRPLEEETAEGSAEKRARSNC